MTTKICYGCKQEKPIEQFSRKKRTKDGLDVYCKACISIKSKQYREAHKDRINEQKRIDYWKSKERAEEKTAKQLLEGTRVCTRCGLEKPLSEFGKRGNGGFYSQCKACVNERMAQYVKDNHDIVIQRKREYHRTHKAQIDSYNKQYYLTHKDEVKQRVKDWEIANPERAKENAVISAHNQRSKRTGCRSNFSLADWKACKEHFSKDGIVRCAYCGKPILRATIDHVVSLNKGGENTVNNVVPSCGKCNSSKFDHPFEEWYKKQPFYSEERENQIVTYLNR